VKWLDEGKNGEIYLLEPALGVETRLTENEVFDGYPVWSPAGDAILFSRQAGPSANEFDLFLVVIEDRSVRRLTEGEGSDVRADWSAAGRGIVFNREQESGTEIMVLAPSRPSG
jgi:TolB protein